MNRKLHIKLALLKHMATSMEAGLLSSDTALFNDCRVAVLPAAGVAEMQALLNELEREGRAVRVVGDLVLYSASAKGHAMILEHGV